MTRPRKLATALLLALVALFALLEIAALADNGLHHDTALRNVSVGGVDVGGQSAEEIRATFATLDARVGQLPVRLAGNDRSIDVAASTAGMTIDVDATTTAVMQKGRGRFASLRWIAGLFEARNAPIVLRVDEARLKEGLAPFGTPRDNSVTFTVQGGMIRVNDGKDGIAADVASVAAELLASARRGEAPMRAAVNTTLLSPTLSKADRNALVDLANRVTVDGITLKLGDATKVIDPAVLRGWIRPSADGSDYLVDDKVSRPAILAAFAGSGGPGRDAKLVVFDGKVLILEGEPATKCCNADTATRVNTALHARSSSTDVAFTETPRPKGREWAAKLGVKELVCEFRTRYPAGQPRVVNIKRIAELTQGALIEPGKTFSINDFVGKRTIENGFVSGGVIQDGVFQEDVGGGISQYATTLFNAAFFGGLDYAKYQSHSIYITRYPYGREATVSYPAPDLEIRNSTPYGVLIWPTATDTGITVQLYSTTYATGTQTGQSEKPFGTACTRVTTERTRTYADGRVPKVDTFSVLYQREGIDCNGKPTAGATTTTTLPPSTTTAPPPADPPLPTTTAQPPGP